MYHCHLHIHLAGHTCAAFDLIQRMPPLERFTHSFTQIASFAGAPKSDLVLANLEGADPRHALDLLTAAKEADSQLILLLEREQLAALTDLSAVYDLWLLPISEQELTFRFLRWQAARKHSTDAWEVNQCLEAVINGSPNMIWFKDKDGIHQKVNDGFCRIVNKPKAQVEGRDHCFIWDATPEDALVCTETDQRVMAARKTCVAEENVKSGDEMKLFITYKTPLFDLDGSVMGTVGVGIDMTRERAYEQELLRKSNTLEAIFTTLECGVLCHSLDGSRILSVNDAALNILGYTSMEDLSSNFKLVADSVLDEDKPILRASIQSLKKEGDSTNIEYRVLHHDGELLHVIGNVKLIRENGELCYQRFLLDFTARKLQQEATERHQAELIQALSADFNLGCFFDLDTGLGIPLQVNGDSRLADIFSGEISLLTSMEQYIQAFVYENDQASLRQAVTPENLIQKLQEKNTYYINYRRPVDGQLEYYEMKVVRGGLWPASHGIVLGLRSVDQEIRYEMEQRKLLEEALVQANNASKAKTTFLSNMSHDIRTPMNAIVGFTTLALSRLDQPAQVEDCLRKIMTSGNHMLSLVNDVLDMSRIESGKLQLEESVCSLTELLNSLSGILQSGLEAKHLQLHMDVSRLTHDKVCCDRLRLNQVLLNVLGNSVKYTGDGGRIDLQLVQTPVAQPDYVTCTFSVRDNGIGMSEEFLSHVFEPFEREQNTTASGVQGTGLGMAITKNMVELMKGSIQVESQKGVGTTVTITFTFRLADQSQPLPSPSAPVAAPAAPRSCSGRLLLVEDNELNQEIALAILSDAGFQVELAENGKRAVELVQRSQPGYYRLILMDVQMPVMNGYEATRAIRALPDPQLSLIPILAMTANAFEEDKQEALRAGMNGHIAKPIDVDTLMATLNSLLA